jgi:glyoxalase/bleomycin resistance protein/dioxygenase superfamily protein
MDHHSLETDACRAALDQVLLDQLPRALPSDTEVIAAMDRLACAEAMPLVKQIAQESINLDIARTDDEKALVGRQAAAQPLFSICTDDCKRDYQDLKRRGVQVDGEPNTMPYGSGVILRDLYGNKIYLTQDPD